MFQKELNENIYCTKTFKGVCLIDYVNCLHRFDEWKPTLVEIKLDVACGFARLHPGGRSRELRLCCLPS